MTTVTFFVSLLSLVFLVLVRMYIQRAGDRGIISKIYLKGDLYFNGILESIIYKYNRWKKISQIFFFEFLPSLLYENLVKAKDYVSRKYYESGDRIRGRRVLRSHGSVSFFLGRLSEERQRENKSHV